MVNSNDVCFCFFIVVTFFGWLYIVFTFHELLIFFCIIFCYCCMYALCNYCINRKIERTDSPILLPITSQQPIATTTDTRHSTDLPQNLPTSDILPSNSQRLDSNNPQSVPNIIQENQIILYNVVDIPETISNSSASSLPTYDLPPSYSCLNLCTNPIEPLPPSYSQCNMSSLD